MEHYTQKSDFDYKVLAVGAPARVAAVRTIAAHPVIFNFGPKTRPCDVPKDLLGECVRISQAIFALNRGIERKEEEDDVGTRDLLFHCTMLIRKMLSVDHPPLDEVIETHIPLLWLKHIEHLNEEFRSTTSSDQQQEVRVPKEFANLQYEMVWSLGRISSGNKKHVDYMRNNNGIKVFIALIQTSQNEEVLDQAVWSLGHFAGNSQPCRDYLHEIEVTKGLVNLHTSRFPTHETAPAATTTTTGACSSSAEETRSSLRQNIMWTLSGLCQGKPMSPHVLMAIPLFLQEIHSFYEDTTNGGDEKCRVSALWALSYIAEDSEESRATIENHQLFSWSTIKRVFARESNNLTLVEPLTRFLGSWAMGSDQECRAFFEHDLVTPVAQLLTAPRPKLVKECAWLLSNLLSGTAEDVRFILTVSDDGKVLDKLRHIVETAGPNVKKEAVWCQLNASMTALKETAHLMIQKGVMESLVKVVETNFDGAMAVECALQGIHQLLGESSKQEAKEEEQQLSFTGGDNEFSYEAKMRIFDVNGLAVFEDCRKTSPPNIGEQASRILQEFFSDFDDTQEQGVDRKWAKSKRKNLTQEESDDDDDLNSDGEGYDL